MSTILDALQKQKTEHSEYFPQRSAGDKGLLKWRAAFLTALLVIICLLAILLYRQFSETQNGVNSGPLQVQNQSRDVQKIPENFATEGGIASAPTEFDSFNERVIETSHTGPEPGWVSKTPQTASKAVKKMTFVTQPLPDYEEPVQLNDRQTAVTADPTVTAEIDDLRIARAESDFVNNDQDELDYGAVSDDLRQRFQLALISSTEKEALSSTAASNDGRDIYEMTAEFQKKVPSLIYDTHIYSTIARERWIKINGEKLKEGQFDGQGRFQLLEIQPNRSIFRLGRQSFSLESLTDWKGY